MSQAIATHIVGKVESGRLSIGDVLMGARGVSDPAGLRVKWDNLSNDAITVIYQRAANQVAREAGEAIPFVGIPDSVVLAYHPIPCAVGHSGSSSTKRFATLAEAIAFAGQIVSFGIGQPRSIEADGVLVADQAQLGKRLGFVPAVNVIPFQTGGRRA